MLRKLPQLFIFVAVIVAGLIFPGHLKAHSTVYFQDGVSGYSGTNDTYLKQYSPTSTFGTKTTVILDGDEPVGTGQDIHALLKWNISAVPVGSIIQSASITLRITNSSLGAYQLFEYLRDWTESTATWNIHSSTAFRGTNVLGNINPIATGTFVLNLNSAGLETVQRWVNNPSSNFGFELANSAQSDGVAFYSSEYSVVSYRPQLSLTYSSETPPPVNPNIFKFVVLPDTQKYSASYPAIFTSQTNWITQNSAAQNIQHVFHEGDIVDTYSNTTQWQRAVTSLSALDGLVPYTLSLGNHDFLNSPRNSSQFNTYFPVSKFQPLAFFGGVFETNKLDNAYYLFSAGGMDFLVLSLEFGPRDETLAWARQIAAAHPARKVILLTHDYLYYDNTWHGSSPSHLYGPDYFGMTDANSGVQIWEKFVRDTPNMFMTLSGHVHTATDGAGTLVSLGTHGNIIYQMEANYQDFPNGGNGYLRVLTLNPADRTLDVKTYSPYLGLYMTDPDNQFSFSNVDYGLPPVPSPTPTPTAPAVTPTPTPRELPAGLIAHWPMDEASGSALTDFSGLNNPASLVNSPTWTQGKIGGGLSFDGLNDYVVGDSVMDNLRARDFTVSVWVKTGIVTNKEPELFSFHHLGYSNRLLVYLNSAGKLRIYDAVTGVYSTSAGLTVFDGAWHHIALSLSDSGNTIKTYIDGVPDMTVASNLSISGSEHFSLAQEYDSGPVTSNFLNGTLDELRIYNRVLTEPEIQTLMQAL